MSETNTITVQGWRCLRCGHPWVPRRPEPPQVCPKCKSPYWNRPRAARTAPADHAK